jgi:glycosyltransferase involved in cell wall biosynthesis
MSESVQPDVSVIVIFKDEEAFLEQAIESVRAQRFPNWELLLADDGSADASTAIAKACARNADGRVRYLEHPGHANLGMSATRNLGLSHATGEFVSLLDADDMLHPHALEEQIAILRAHPRVGMVYGPLEYWYGWTGLPEDGGRDFVYPVGVPADRIYEPPSLIALFVRDVAFAPSGMLLRRSVVEQVGGFEQSFRDLYEDQVFAAKICRTTPVYVSSRCFYRYRQHPASCCNAAAREGRLDAARRPFLRWLAGYLEDQQLGGSDAWRVARDELRWEPWRRWARRARLEAARNFARRLAAAAPAGAARR